MSGGRHRRPSRHSLWPEHQAPHVTSLFHSLFIHASWLYIVFSLYGALALLNHAPEFAVHAPANTHAVLVTGAASGIGKHSVCALVDAGYFVFAGVRQVGFLS